MSPARLFALCGFAAALSGCGLITAPTEESRLSAARRVWSAAKLTDYRYEVRSVCECLQGGRWIAITVIAGTVRSGTFLDNNTPVETLFLAALPTVPALFDRIQHAVTESAVLLQVEYDPADGHPVLINVDGSRAIADDEFSVYTRNLGVLRGSTAAQRSK